ncbi:hypothetical protein [Desulfurispira natronophila]|uniref:Uncharacterized protein n=1 Tax=Desulfurispira natronophila TaxID=682562 RepID=A0A7W8DI07_9BACT|nr:hypothetical protein [Desulfurispira natronophila]MBB5022907.1 hypothetical protein [Desulfurispira natronophila]
MTLDLPREYQGPMPIVTIYRYEANSPLSAEVILRQQGQRHRLTELSSNQTYMVATDFQNMRTFSPLIEFSESDSQYHYRHRLQHPQQLHGNTEPIIITISLWEEQLLVSYALQGMPKQSPVVFEPPLALLLPREFRLTAPLDGALQEGYLLLRSAQPGRPLLSLLLDQKSRIEIPLPESAQIATIGNIPYHIERSSNALTLSAHRGYRLWIAWGLIAIIGTYGTYLIFPSAFRYFIPSRLLLP